MTDDNETQRKQIFAEMMRLDERRNYLKKRIAKAAAKFNATGRRDPDYGLWLDELGQIGIMRQKLQEERAALKPKPAGFIGPHFMDVAREVLSAEQFSAILSEAIQRRGAQS